MNLIDLEMYRWKWFHDIYVHMKKTKKARITFFKLGTGYPAFWKEFGAFVSTLPRGSGKTEMLYKIKKELSTNNEKYIVVTPNHRMKDNIVRRGVNPGNVYTAVSIDKSLEFFKHDEYNLMIDEYNLVGDNALNSVLSYPWKTVTMVGTLR